MCLFVSRSRCHFISCAGSGYCWFRCSAAHLLTCAPIRAPPSIHWACQSPMTHTASRLEVPFSLPCPQQEHIHLGLLVLPAAYPPRPIQYPSTLHIWMSASVWGQPIKRPVASGACSAAVRICLKLAAAALPIKPGRQLRSGCCFYFFLIL